MELSADGSLAIYLLHHSRPSSHNGANEQLKLAGERSRRVATLPRNFLLANHATVVQGILYFPLVPFSQPLTSPRSVSC